MAPPTSPCQPFSDDHQVTGTRAVLQFADNGGSRRPPVWHEKARFFEKVQPLTQDAFKVTLFIANLPLALSEVEKARLTEALPSHLGKLGPIEHIKIRFGKTQPYGHRATDGFAQRHPIAFAVLSDARLLEQVRFRANTLPFMEQKLRIEPAWSQNVLYLRPTDANRTKVNLHSLRSKEPWVSICNAMRTSLTGFPSEAEFDTDLIRCVCNAFGPLRCVQACPCFRDGSMKDVEVIFYNWQDCLVAGKTLATWAQSVGIQPYMRTDCVEWRCGSHFQDLHRLSETLGTSPTISTPPLTRAHSPVENETEKASALAPMALLKDRLPSKKYGKHSLVDEYCVYVTHFQNTQRITEELRLFFANGVQLPEVCVNRSKMSDTHFAFVRFSSKEGAHAALQKHNQFFNGQPLIVRQRLIRHPTKAKAKAWRCETAKDRAISWDDQMREDEVSRAPLRTSQGGESVDLVSHTDLHPQKRPPSDVCASVQLPSSNVKAATGEKYVTQTIHRLEFPHQAQQINPTFIPMPLSFPIPLQPSPAGPFQAQAPCQPQQLYASLLPFPQNCVVYPGPGFYTTPQAFPDAHGPPVAVASPSSGSQTWPACVPVDVSWHEARHVLPALSMHPTLMSRHRDDTPFDPQQTSTPMQVPAWQEFGY